MLRPSSSTTGWPPTRCEPPQTSSAWEWSSSSSATDEAPNSRTFPLISLRVTDLYISSLFFYVILFFLIFFDLYVYMWWKIDAHKIVEDQFGNYVIQEVLNKVKDASVQNQVKSKLEGRYVYLSKQKFSSNVVESLLNQHASNQWRAAIIQELIAPATIAELLNHQFANYVNQTDYFSLSIYVFSGFSITILIVLMYICMYLCTLFWLIYSWNDC